jgi:phage/plasmid-associated DNA primase
LPGNWFPGRYDGTLPQGSLLLTGSFLNDPDTAEKIELIEEIAGVTISGHGTKLTSPKAIVLLGREAENGKSQILDTRCGVLLADAVSHVSPGTIGNANSRAQLVGKLLNTSDELDTTKAIACEELKKAVTGNPQEAKLLFANVFSFKARAQHVYAWQSTAIISWGNGPRCQSAAPGHPLQSNYPHQTRG